MIVREGEPEVANTVQELSTFKRRPEYDWPLARTRYTKLYLGPAGELSTEALAVEEKVFMYKAPK